MHHNIAVYTKASTKHAFQTPFSVFGCLEFFTSAITHQMLPSHRNLLRVAENKMYTRKVSTQRRQEPAEGEKLSKHIRRKASVASHGDYRRSLYEVTI